MYKYVIKFKIFSPPPSRFEINNLSATNTPLPLDIDWFHPLVLVCSVIGGSLLHLSTSWFSHPYCNTAFFTHYYLSRVAPPPPPPSLGIFLVYLFSSGFHKYWINLLQISTVLNSQILKILVTNIENLLQPWIQNVNTYYLHQIILTYYFSSI